MSPAPQRQLYWRRTLRVTLAGLSLWLAATLMLGVWAPGWAGQFFGWPFGFWATAQGCLILYCLIVWVYAQLMDRLDADDVEPAPAD